MKKSVFLGLVCSLVCIQAAVAAEPEPPKAVVDALQRLIPNLKPDSLAEAPIPGFVEAVYGAEIIYISQDGKYLLRGDILDTANRDNLTENKREGVRLDILGKIPDKEMIIFSEDNPRHFLYVFTDLDCPYCAKLHREVPELTRNGIAVKYLAYPRAGIGSPSFKKYISVYCAEDQQTALTKAKAGQPPEPKECDNPVEQQFLLGRRLGVTGTPTLILDSGQKIPGYVPAKELIKIFNTTPQS